MNRFELAQRDLEWSKKLKVRTTPVGLALCVDDLAIAMIACFNDDGSLNFTHDPYEVQK